MPENRNNTGQFKKGKSGNPGGRPKLPEEFKDIAKTNAITALQKVIDILVNPASDDKDKLRAAEIIMDRAYGKAKQEIDNNNTNTNLNTDLTTLDAEERQKRIDELMKKLGR